MSRFAELIVTTEEVIAGVEAIKAHADTQYPDVGKWVGLALALTKTLGGDTPDEIKGLLELLFVGYSAGRSQVPAPAGSGPVPAGLMAQAGVEPSGSEFKPYEDVRVTVSC
jgi:hypothetical protein